jgi:hypothetical protein
MNWTFQPTASRERLIGINESFTAKNYREATEQHGNTRWRSPNIYRLETHCSHLGTEGNKNLIHWVVVKL